MALGRLESRGLAGVGKDDRRLEALRVLVMPHGAGVLWRGVLQGTGVLIGRTVQKPLPMLVPTRQWVSQGMGLWVWVCVCV